MADDADPAKLARDGGRLVTVTHWEQFNQFLERPFTLHVGRPGGIGGQVKIKVSRAEIDRNNDHTVLLGEKLRDCVNRLGLMEFDDGR